MKSFKAKALSMLLVMIMALSLCACGSSSNDTKTEPEKTEETAATEETATDEAEEPADDTAATDDTAEAADEGKVLNIYCWNDEFQQRMTTFYPGYTDNGDGTGSIGDVTVNWLMTPSQDNAYQNKLDEALLAQESAADDDKIDLFLIEADYALKYVDTEYALDVVNDLGLTEDELSQQYQYTKDIVTDSNGVLRGVSWQATPGLFVYRRSIAKDVLGTDDPEKVQEELADWDKFDAVAAKMGEKGYTMLSGFADSYRVFSNNVSTPWVVDGKIVIDDNIMRWVDQTKEYTDKGYNHKTDLWADDWGAQQSSKGNTFGFFYSTWGINYTLVGYALDTAVADGGKLEVGNGTFGDWACCYGPQSFYWGGTWICGCKGSDNKALVADIMRKLTTDKDIMKSITEAPDVQDYTNNMEAMKEIGESDFKSDFLGGQNHIALFTESAANIDMSNCTAYDQGLNEGIQTAMKDYFNGQVTKEEALENFYKAAETKYPELTH